VRRPSPRRRRPCRRTPLHHAAGNRHSDVIVAELLLRGADGAVQDNYG
jgi:ankyrin repeat protein